MDIKGMFLYISQKNVLFLLMISPYISIISAHTLPSQCSTNDIRKPVSYFDLHLLHALPSLQCPGCHQEVVPKSEGQCVVCRLCSKVKRRVFRFCWDCQREWSCKTSSNTCTQPNCALRAALLSDKRISDPNSSAKGCPYFRACPGCNGLLTHNGQGCPNITCPVCATEFCFRCLRPRCFRTDLVFYFLRNRQRLNEVEHCTIVENSERLMQLC